MIQAKYSINTIILEGEGKFDDVTSAEVFRISELALVRALDEALTLLKPGIASRLNALFQVGGFHFQLLHATVDEYDGVRVQYNMVVPDGAGYTVGKGLKLAVNAANLAIVTALNNIKAVLAVEVAKTVWDASGFTVSIDNLEFEDNSDVPSEPTQAAQIKAYKEEIVVGVAEFLAKKRTMAGDPNWREYFGFDIPPPDSLRSKLDG